MSAGQSEETAKPSKTPLWIAGVLSVVYIVVIFLLIKSCFIKLEEPLTLNTLGDFLAGVFGPLSFLWLVAGYFQQQQELRLNTEELSLSRKAQMLQVNELEKQVEQNRVMIATQQQQLLENQRANDFNEYKAKQDAKPHFVVHFVDREKGMMNVIHGILKLKNVGQPANDLTVYVEGFVDQATKLAFLKTDGVVDIEWEEPPRQEFYEKTIVVIYHDSLSHRHERKFHIEVDEGEINVVDPNENK